MAATRSKVQLLERLWVWAKELQLNPEELRNIVCLSKDNSGQTPWHEAALRGKVEVFEKLWDWATELQLNPEDLRIKVCFSKDNSGQTPWHKAAGSATLKY